MWEQTNFGKIGLLNDLSLLVIVLTKVLNSPALWVESYFKTAPHHLIKQQVIQSALDQVAIWFRQHLIRSSFDPVIKKSIYSRVLILKIISLKTHEICVAVDEKFAKYNFFSSNSGYRWAGCWRIKEVVLTLFVLKAAFTPDLPTKARLQCILRKATSTSLSWEIFLWRFC